MSKLLDTLVRRERFGAKSFDVRPLTKNRLTLVTDGDPSLDIKKMAATVIISTQKRDRSRDIVLTKGIYTKNHQLNPVVLLEHGTNLKLPIGKAQDENGRYTVRLDDDKAIATTYFAQNNEQAEQVYALVEQGILRGASIGFKPIKYKMMNPDNAEPGMPGLFLEEVELLEYSHCVIPDNPECVVAIGSVIGKNRLAGRQIDSVIYKSLMAYAPQRREMVNGYSFGGKSMNADVGMTENGNAGQTLPDQQPMKKMKPGAIALCKFHDHLSEMAELMGGLGEEHEHPDVQKFFDEHGETFGNMARKASELYKRLYPTYEPLGGQAEPDGDVDEEMQKSHAEARRKFIARMERLRNDRVARDVVRLTKSHKSKLALLCDFLAELAEHRGGTSPSQRSAARLHKAALQEALGTSQESPDELAEMQKKLEEYETKSRVQETQIRELAEALETTLEQHKALKKQIRLAKQGV